MRRVAIGLAGLLFLGACSGSSDEPTPTDSPSPTATPFDDLRRWLTSDRQERLADLVATTAKEHGWSAGCVFRYNWDDKVLNEFPWPGGKAAYSVVNDPKLAPALIMFVEGSSKAGGSFKEFLSSGSVFCYVPE